MLYEKILRPLIFLVSRRDPEIAHLVFLKALALSQSIPFALKYLSGISTVRDAKLEQKIFGLKFPNPVGLAAGFDKNAVVVRGLAALGFGFIEIGTVTRFAQPGNQRPRIFRLPKEKALINRMGFNNDGADLIAKRLASLQNLGIPLGINLGKSHATEIDEAAEDYSYSLKTLYDYGNYFVINVSSPNTPGLQSLQEKSRLNILLKSLTETAVQLSKYKKEQPKPLLVKISPDLTYEALDDLLRVCSDNYINGLIVANTAINRDGIAQSSPEIGGFSGKPLFPRTLELVRHIRRLFGYRMEIIASGGITEADDAYRILKDGADLLQVYTGLVYNGPLIARKINKKLLEFMKHGYLSHLSGIR